MRTERKSEVMENHVTDLLPELFRNVLDKGGEEVG